MLPHDLLPKSTVYDYFVQWRDDGTWAKMVTVLREQTRVAAGRAPTPSVVCIDSQSVKTTEMGGPERGYDGGKKINGRKRHLLVDTLGLLLVFLMTKASLDDGAAAALLLSQVHPYHFPRLVTIFADGINEMDPPLCGAIVIRQNGERGRHHHSAIGGECHEARYERRWDRYRKARVSPGGHG